jgi:hypothetical protein
MSKQDEKPFVRAFRLYFIVEREQNKVRKDLLKSKDNRVVIPLTNRYDILQRRKDKLNRIKLKL